MMGLPSSSILMKVPTQLMLLVCAAGFVVSGDSWVALPEAVIGERILITSHDHDGGYDPEP